ncbi:RNA polymerase sigma factor [Aquiflexum sp.]|uniref:RNA polymerase sigma factor n=1 Tax=Aquiflexum sp. TaxID=1872584 RepID=UPI0035933ABB
MDFRALSETELWKLIVNGNQDAYGYIYSSLSRELYKYGYKFTSDTYLIEDAIQDVFVNIWEIRKSLIIQKSIKFYLISCFRREIIKKINASYKNETLEEYHSWEVSFQEIMEENQIGLETSISIANALEVLPARQKEAIYLRYIQGLSYIEISGIMGVQTPSIYNLIFKGLKSLKSSLSSHNISTILMVFLLKIFY